MYFQSAVCVVNITNDLNIRTAYPRFKQFPNAKELAELYTPTPEEIKLAKSKTKSHEGFVSFIIMLNPFNGGFILPIQNWFPSR